MKKENVVICPPCGENVALATKRGANKENLFGALLPRLTAVLPPQGREITTHGFTLIELLVVVLIIGILAAVAVPQYQKVVWKAEAMRMFPVLDAVDKAQQVYYLANGTYATNITDLDIEIPAGASIVGNTITYPQFYCSTSHTGSIKCYFSSNHALHPLSLERYFFLLEDYDNAKTLCWAPKNKPQQQNMCIALGGTPQEHTNKTYNLYTLN